MLNIIRSTFVCLLMLWLPALQAADSGWLQSPTNDHAKVRLRADTSQPGETRLLLAIELQKGWKTYWRSPGEGGIAPAITWQSNPPPVTWYWPTPQRFEVAGISTQGYHDRVELPMVMKGTAPRQLAGTLTLSTCSNVCILTDYPFSLDLAAPSDAQFDHDFAQAMGQVPIAEGLVESIKAGYLNGELQISAERAAGWQQPELFFDTLEDADLGKPRVSSEGSLMTARVPVSDGWGDSAPDLRGKTLTLVIGDGGMAQQVTLPIGGPLPSAASFTLWQAVLMALAGGLILNLMPCVLPVLGIKLGSILQVEQRDRHSIRLQFLASSFGIVASFMALALLMTLLRLSNQALGWGIQFQNPWFIGFMVLVTLLFSANLFGLFHLQLSSSLNTKLATHNGRGLSGHFWQGAFATLLATPCSAPFLGTAVAFALAAPLPVLWGMFVAGYRHEPALAADCRMACFSAAPAASGALDEHFTVGHGSADAGFFTVAAEPDGQSYWHLADAGIGRYRTVGLVVGGRLATWGSSGGQAGGRHAGAGRCGVTGRFADRRAVASAAARQCHMATAK